MQNNNDQKEKNNHELLHQGQVIQSPKTTTITTTSRKGKVLIITNCAENVELGRIYTVASGNFDGNASNHANNGIRKMLKSCATAV